MKTKFLSVALTAIIFCITSVKAQYLNDLNGRPIRAISYTEMEGSPYLMADWTPGTVKMNNHTYEGVQLKYDVLRDELLFKNNKDEPMNFIEPVSKFTLSIPGGQAMIYQNGYPAAAGSKLTNETYYRVLSEGKVHLLKKTVKNIIETKAYESSVILKKITDNDSYYLFANGQLIKIKRDKKSIYAALDNQQYNKMDIYLKSNNIMLKTDAEATALIDFYNTL